MSCFCLLNFQGHSGYLQNVIGTLKLLHMNVFQDTNMINNSMHEMYARISRGSISTPIYIDSPSPSELCEQEQHTATSAANEPIGELHC